jgi:hypothetical protein
MEFKDALKTDIKAEPIVKGAFLGGIVATGGAYVATALGIGGGGALAAGGAGTTVAGGVTSAACADGDCTNEVQTVTQATKQVKNIVQEISRPLQAADLGVEGTIYELEGTLSLGSDGIANVRIDMIRADITNPLSVIPNLSNTARQLGAHTLRIDATIANEKLFRVLSRLYDVISEGANEYIVIPLVE